MKYLGGPGRRQARPRTRARRRAFGVTAAFTLTAFALVAAQQLTRETTASKPAKTLSPVELTLPGHGPGAGVGHAERHLQARLPFEPLVPRMQQETPQARAADEWSMVEVAPGDNLSLIFSRLKLSKRDLHDIDALDHEDRHLRKLRPGQLLRIRADGEQLRTLVLEIDQLNSLWIERGANGFEMRIETVEPEIRIAEATTAVSHSLFVDGQRAGLSDALIMSLTDIFGWDIDFALDLRPDDRFSVIYEEVFKEGQLVKQGRILAAEFVNRGNSHRAVLFTDPDGQSAYYSEEGRPMRKAFLRTPVNFTRISSKFNLSRRHPILNTIRAHRGVDYAAPMGTPVRATANGTIRTAGSKGGYGLTLEVQHGRAYGTLYAHLSRFAKGIRRGTAVKQGQVIGYVGKSGLATGPHLHYEFRVNGVHRNPLTVDLPQAEPLEGRLMADFREHAATLFSRLDSLYAQHDAPARPMLAQVDSIDEDSKRN